ncbi:MAG: hypothetical protein H6811_01615 [Phycisphaeraceae bacterium]|nr:hypothetical protein [Phycisphaeraceae bacterium]
MVFIVRSDLWRLLQPHLAHYVLGRCVHVGLGEVIRGYSTVYTPIEYSTYTRGERGAKYYVCKHCGLPHLEADGTESLLQYFIRGHLRGRHAAQVGCHGTFIITPWLRDQIDWSQFPDIELGVYPVLDRPLDGRRFPGDPDWDAMR